MTSVADEVDARRSAGTEVLVGDVTLTLPDLLPAEAAFRLLEADPWKVNELGQVVGINLANSRQICRAFLGEQFDTLMGAGQINASDVTVLVVRIVGHYMNAGGGEGEA